MIRDYQPVQWPRQADSLAVRGDDLVAAREPERVLRTECGANGPRIQRIGGVQVRVAPEDPGGEVAPRVGRIGPVGALAFSGVTGTSCADAMGAIARSAITPGTSNSLFSLIVVTPA